MNKVKPSINTEKPKASTKPSSRRYPTSPRKRPRGPTAAQRVEIMKMHMRSDDMKDEIIEYTVDHPNRVSVRMEYLMHTTKARINDIEFMDTLGKRLIAEENKDLAGQTKAREWIEKDRVKNLVIDGQMDPPADMKELENHPVYKITTLTKRIVEWSKSFHAGGAALPEITPVEPYEFDGDQFFRHLHQNGTYWIPSEERIAEEERMAGKIARAKLRYLEKKYHMKQREKLLYKLKSAHPSLEDIARKPNESKDNYELRKRKQRIARVKSQLFRETETRTQIFRRKRQVLERRERIRKDKADKRKRERDIIFLGDRDHERREYLNRYLEKVATKTVVNYKRPGTPKKSKVVLSVNPNEEEEGSDSSTEEAAPGEMPKVHEGHSFEALLKAFKVGGGYSLSKFMPAVSPVFQKYVQVAETMDELTENSKNLTDMFNREQIHADKCLNQMRRMNLPHADPPAS